MILIGGNVPDTSDSSLDTLAVRRKTLFLSHSRADRAVIEKLSAALSAAGHEVWWDAMIEGGATFAKSIETALEQAEGVIVLWSKTSIESDWVRDEAAQGRDRKRLIPLSLNGTLPPLGFRQYQVIAMDGWRGRSDGPEFVALMRCIDALGSDATGKQPVAARVYRGAPSRRAIIGVGAAGGAVLIGGGLFAWHEGWLGGVAEARSIAVIPFTNMSGDPAQGYFSDGLSDEIRSTLARNDALEVLAATSSNTARAHKDDAITTARRLGVANILEGSVRRSNDIFRISADLIDGKTGFSRWQKSFDRKISDIFAVQTEIARTVAEALATRIAAADGTLGGTTNVPAYEAFLRGREMFNAARDEATDRAGLAQFDLAIAADPNFAMAHAARSRSLAAIAGEYAKADALRSLYDSAIVAADTAITIAPKLAEAHLAKGYALYTGRLDIGGARASYDRAYALGHGNADILVLFALYCSRAGRAGDARTAIDRAIALDPLNPRTFRAAGSIAYAARRYDDALAPLQKALTLNPDISNAHALIGSALLQLGKLNEARAAFDAEPHALFKLTGLAVVSKKLGDDAAAGKAMNQLIADLGDSALYQQAEVRAQWGETEAALATIERAKAIGDPGLVYLATDPMLDSLRSQPRFKAILSSIGGG
jgi:TolB-like protein/Tfp pilus assembly protein PilF